MKNIDQIILLLLGQSSPNSVEKMGWLPIVIAVVVILLIILTVGIWIWRTVFSEDEAFDANRPFSAESFDDSICGEVTTKMLESTVPYVPLDPKKVFSSADTVDNKDDEFVEDLNSRFSSQPTVEETGDSGVRFHSKDDNEST